jgi:serine/threonine protein kinase
MSVFQSLSVVALRQLVSTAGSAVGLGTTTDVIIDSLTKRFTDHSQKLTKALQTANERAWKALEIALAGDSLLDRCKSTLASAEDRAFSEQLSAFLAESPLRKVKADQQQFLRRALEELRSARANRMLIQGSVPPAELAQQTGAFASFRDPQALLNAELKLVEGIAAELKDTCPKLCVVLTHPKLTPNILVTAVRYFFRREVETDTELFHGLAIAKLEALQEGQERGFASLTDALTQQGRRLEGLLDDLLEKVGDIQARTAETNVMVRGLVDQVQQLVARSQLQNREVRPSDSLSIRNDAERQLVKNLVLQYRALPAEEQRNPALLNNLGKLQVVVGDFKEAQRDFQAVATMTPDPKAQAEAYFNAYQAALEQKAWAEALASLRQAIALDAGRFAPFPLETYEPQKILGAGGFGVAFLCNHTFMGDRVVVKTLRSEELDCDVNRVFAEARALRQVDHPSIIRILHCGYADPARTRAFLVMDYFDGVNLESYIAERGTLSYEDMLAVASHIAAALQAAHAREILHRDVKPENVLVRRDASGWQVKLIDFGLALRPEALERPPSTSGPRAQTTIGKSIAGTLHFAAPEQMGQGQPPGVAVGRYSDVYGFGRTCYYALFQTPSPDREEEDDLPPAWGALLRQCTRRDATKRHQDFTAVLGGLAQVREALMAKPTPPLNAPGNPITRADVLAAMKEIDETGGASWTKKHKWAVHHESRYYPPKDLWGKVIRAERLSDFNTHDAIRELKRLGFSIVPSGEMAMHGPAPSGVDAPFEDETDTATEPEDEHEQPERHGLRLKFWEGLLRHPRIKDTGHANLKPGTRHWLGTGSGVRGLPFTYVIFQREARVEIYIDRGSGKVAENKQIFNQLYSHKDEIEKTFGGELSWQRLDDKRACRICHDMTIGGIRSEESKWPEIHDAMIDAMIRLEKALAPHLAQMKTELTAKATGESSGDDEDAARWVAMTQDLELSPDGEGESSQDSLASEIGLEANAPSGGMKQTYEATLQDLIAAGQLSPPLRLFSQYKGKLLEAKLLTSGKIEFAGQIFNTSSAAGEVARASVTGKKMNTNGWTFWQYLDAAGNAATLADAREKLLASKRCEG